MSAGVRTFVAAACLGMLLHASPAAAQGAVPADDAGVWLSRQDAAVIFDKARQADLLQRDVESLKAELEQVRREKAALETLYALEQRKSTLHEEIAALEAKRAEAYKKAAGAKCRYAAVAGAGTGAAAGSLGGPIGMGAGAVIGGIVGYFGCSD